MMVRVATWPRLEWPSVFQQCRWWRLREWMCAITVTDDGSWTVVLGPLVLFSAWGRT